ncbi:MAG TPA: RNA polymerase sigma factor [Solirubrobacteraceae bacterium]|nr:RNA polymerase sigma factor [Solirubrobacteraceae bacterium]
MEASALRRQPTLRSLGMPGPMLRMQSDERLIALTRRGNNAAFEVLCSRYQARLLAFCRHMLASREDAEDVLQEVFAAAFNAILADEREINAKPWLYRIARNRSLNHLRRASAVGVDSMDIHFAENGITTSDKVMRRESFRELVNDVGELPETQRTALLLREIDDLSYDQIAAAMDTTVPSVKSLLVRARMSLADAAEARKLTCEDVRIELAEAAEGLGKPTAGARRHTRDCERCGAYKRTLKDNNKVLAGLAPVAPLLLLKNLFLGKIGSSAGHAAAGSGASAGTAAGGGVASSGLVTAGIGAVASKAAAGIAAAALVTAGAVAVTHSTPEGGAAETANVAHAAPAVAAAHSDAPAVLHRAAAAHTVTHVRPPAGPAAPQRTAAPATTTTPATVSTATGQPTEVTTEETKLPGATTEASAQGASSTTDPIATTGPTGVTAVGAPEGERASSEEEAPAATETTTTTPPPATEEVPPAGETPVAE